MSDIELPANVDRKGGYTESEFIEKYLNPGTSPAYIPDTGPSDPAPVHYGINWALDWTDGPTPGSIIFRSVVQIDGVTTWESEKYLYDSDVAKNMDYNTFVNEVSAEAEQKCEEFKGVMAIP